MILDYSYNPYVKRFDVSYIEDNGSKQLLSFNISRFKAYYSTPSGKYTNWAGDKCDVKYVEKPSRFEIKTFLTELDEKYKNLLTKKTFPKVYTFDIETLANENGEYSEPENAKGPISTISICSPDLNTIVLGTQQFSDSEKATLENNFTEYLNNTAFFRDLQMKMPYVRYVYFNTEEEMLRYFLNNIVSKVPILSGWNCIKYDWNYIVNRIKNFYPGLSVKLASCTKRVANKNYKDRFGNKIILPMPEHTLILDMMEIIEQEDKKVLPMKESMKLDYIAAASMGIHKIEYTRTLDDLYKNDYGRYVFYNSIDSVLVQLINYKFKTMDHIYLYALYCNEKISSCFSKIALTEALVYKDFYEQGLKIVYEDKPEPVRSSLVGAYVKKPVPGVHQFVCCNDFASLYPSTIRTCNLSFENYIGAYWDNEALHPFRTNRSKYVVIGPNVFNNEGTADKPSTGSLVGVYLDENRLAEYRADTDKYFISVNGCVYKNDRDYSFRRIQAKLKAARDHDKYLGKRIDASVMSDVDKAAENKKLSSKPYEDDIIDEMKSIGLDICCPADLNGKTPEELKNIKSIVQNEIVYLDSNQLAMKYLMNSMYGGASHVNFYWYNMNIANDITGEARNLIHRMEHHIPEFVRENWLNLTDLHKELGIEIDADKAEEILKSGVPDSVLADPDAYHKASFITPVYGDTDSCNALTIIKLQDNFRKEKEMTIEEWFNKNNKKEIFVTQNGSEMIKTKDKVLNYNDNGKLEYHPVKYIMRHKVTKPKWVLKTKSGKEITVTNDHSMIVFRDGKKLKVKPSEIQKTDKILVVED